MEQKDFKPRGAVAFFIVMLLLYGVMWASVYFQVLGRR